MKQLNQVTGQITGEHRQQQFIANKIAKNLWYKIQRELVSDRSAFKPEPDSLSARLSSADRLLSFSRTQTQQQVEEVREIATAVQQQQPQVDRMTTDETLVGQNKEQMKQLEKDLVSDRSVFEPEPDPLQSRTAQC